MMQSVAITADSSCDLRRGERRGDLRLADLTSDELSEMTIEVIGYAMSARGCCSNI